MTRQDTDASRLSDALAACPILFEGMPGWDQLWITLGETICTTKGVWLSPRGSSTAYFITPDDNSVELMAAIRHAQRHEAAVRAMTPNEQMSCLRRAATVGPEGSARAAQRDALCGMTQVAKGSPVRIVSYEAWLGGSDDGLSPAV